MFENESFSCVHIKKINKYLSKTESLFVKRLYFWSSHRKSYGIEKEGRVWIYNTLDQWADMLGVSKSSIRRSLKYLKDKGIIDSDYLAPNKRNRTLSYSINYEKLNEYLSSFKKYPCVHYSDLRSQKNTSSEHMDEHMYIMDNSKQIINKSYKSNKSIKNKIQKNSDQIMQKKPFLDLKDDKNEILSANNTDAGTKLTENIIIEDSGIATPHQKPTIIQDMIKIWNEEFSLSKIELSKNLARFLVAAFKTKFKACLKEWRKYLKIIKTSTFIMGEKFTLSIWWVIKFITIDRIRAGELGVKPDKITLDKEELAERLNQHVVRLDETESCKKLRYSIIEKLSLPTYLSWFTHVRFVEIEDSNNKNYRKIFMKAESQFVEDWIKNNFAEECGFCVG